MHLKADGEDEKDGEDERKSTVPTVAVDGIVPLFRKILKKLKINGRRGIGFYTFRHCFETIGGECRDQVAVDAIMGHADASMAANYRHGISDDRLRAVVDTIHDWLWPVVLSEVAWVVKAPNWVI